jgi:hypothetical protein
MEGLMTFPSSNVMVGMLPTMLVSMKTVLRDMNPQVVPTLATISWLHVKGPELTEYSLGNRTTTLRMVELTSLEVAESAKRRME